MGDMQADLFYTSGVAVDKFFEHLKNNDGFMVCKCKKCNKIYCPPRLYCEDCFDEIPDDAWSPVAATGKIRLFTVAMLDAHGEKLAVPRVMALIDIDNTDSAMLGVIKTSDLDADLTGKSVKAILKPKDKREGTLKDIVCWE